MTNADAMSKQRNPFYEILKGHPKCTVMHLAQAAFNSTTYRIFSKGSGGKIREFVAEKIGDGHRFIAGRNFEREHANVLKQFPGTIRLNKNSNKELGYGHKAKVIDLYLKTLYCQREPLTASAAKRLGRRLHVPLDNIVLDSFWIDFSRILSNRKRAVLELDGERVVKSDLCLSELNEGHYHAIQKVLRDQAGKAGTIAILYDDRYVKGSEQSRSKNGSNPARSYRKVRKKN
jgi:hypothetical protein